LISFTNLRLRNQLNLLIIVAIVALIAAQLFYYVSFRSLTKDRAYVYFDSLTNQIETKISAINKDVESIANIISYSQSIQKYLMEEDSLKRFRVFEFVQDNLNYTLSSNSNIQSIKIIGRDFGSFKSSSDDKLQVYYQINKEYDLEDYNISNPFYTRIYTDKPINKLFYAYITPIYSFLRQPFERSPAAICIILCKLDLVQNLIDSVSMPPNGHLILLDNYDTIIASTERESIGEKLDEDLSNIVESQVNGNKVIYNEMECLYQLTLIENPSWKIISIIPINELMKDMKPILKIGLIFNILITIILLVIGIIIINNITNPVSNIIMDMEKIGEQYTGYRLRIPGKNEIGIIADNINSMLERIETMNKNAIIIKENLYKTELAKKQAELSFLQSQINPHFLYNTLECMKNIGVVYDVPEIIKISTSMAKIFRYSIKEQEFVTIKDEIECVKDYFAIISIRYMDKHQLVIDIMPEMLNYNMPKMILQPIIENSVYHGLEVKNQEGMVYMRGYYEKTKNDEISNNEYIVKNIDENIVFEIEDNGVGMTEDQVCHIKTLLNSDNISEQEFSDNGRSIGLLNIDRRLKLNYGENYGISIFSELGKGTIVKFKIPKIPKIPMIE
jgi:two-component system sensor histidine kinase YesM